MHKFQYINQQADNHSYLVPAGHLIFAGQQANDYSYFVPMGHVTLYELASRHLFISYPNRASHIIVASKLTLIHVSSQWVSYIIPARKPTLIRILSLWDISRYTSQQANAYSYFISDHSNQQADTYSYFILAGHLTLYQLASRLLFINRPSETPKKDLQLLPYGKPSLSTLSKITLCNVILETGGQQLIGPQLQMLMSNASSTLHND